MEIEIELKDSSFGESIVTLCTNCNSLELNNPFGTDEKDKKWLKGVEEPRAVQVVLEEYSNKKKGKGISHGLCYECLKELYPEFYKD